MSRSGARRRWARPRGGEHYRACRLQQQWQQWQRQPHLHLRRCDAARLDRGDPGRLGRPAGRPPRSPTGTYPANAPNWILPITTAAFNSVYNTYVFDWQMWRPLYYYPQGTTITVDQQLSLANPPVWSNGDKTMSITLKDWKWSNGQTLSSKDLLFTIDEIAAAVKASPANWAAYVPGFFPDTITSMSTPNASTLVVNMKSAVNPTWMEEDILAPSRSCPPPQWAKDSASGPTLDFTKPGERGEDLQLPHRAGQVGEHLRDEPALADRVRAVQADLLQRHHRCVHLGAEHHLQRVARESPCPTSWECRSPPTPLSSTPSRAGQVDVAVVPPEDAPQLSTLKGIGYNYFGLPAFGDYFVSYNFLDKTGDFNNIVSQLYFRQAMQHLEDQQGQIKAYLNGAGDPGLQDRSRPTRRARSALQREDESLPVQRVHRRERAQGERLERRRLTAPTPARTPGLASGDCGAGIPAGTKLAFNLIYNTISPITQEVEDLASNAKAGRHRDHPVGQQLQLHDPELQRHGVAGEREQVGHGGLRWRDASPPTPPRSAS